MPRRRRGAVEAEEEERKEDAIEFVAVVAVDDEFAAVRMVATVDVECAEDEVVLATLLTRLPAAAAPATAAVVIR